MQSAIDAEESALAKSYDDTPYAGHPHPFTHPGLISALGVLHGVSPASPTACRVLELGCGDGNNLIPMAYELPQSTFVGIDLSPVQIEIGRKLTDTLDLRNIHLEARSITDVASSFGSFDYIICHGVYSWVPDRVKAKILDICRHHLSPQGIAYISYNVLPGWRFNQTMRDMLRFRTRHIEAPEGRIQAGFDLLDTLVTATAENKGVHDVELRYFDHTLKKFAHKKDYFFHEYLETNNDPFYFHQFAAALDTHHLQYICDAEQTDFELDNLSEKAATTFEAIAENATDIEQYIDFLKNTRFRRSLVCHAGIELGSDYHFERIQRLFAATDTTPVLDTPKTPVEETTAFRTLAGRQFRTQHPYALSILRNLSSTKPCTMNLPSLIDTVMGDVPLEPGQDRQTAAQKIGSVVYSLYFDGVLELVGAPRRCVSEISERPTASAIARLNAPSRQITTLCHRTIEMHDDVACFLLSHLDGDRTMEDLLDLVLENIHRGRLAPTGPETPAAEVTRESMHKQLRAMLRSFAHCGLLVA